MKLRTKIILGLGTLAAAAAGLLGLSSNKLGASVINPIYWKLVLGYLQPTSNSWKLKVSEIAGNPNLDITTGGQKIGEINPYYTRFGVNHSPLLVGELPSITDPLNRIPFGVFASTSMGMAQFILNNGTASSTTGNLIIGNDLTQVGSADIPTHITLLGRTNSNYNQPSLPLKGPDMSYLYSSEGDMLVGTAGTTTLNGNLRFFSGDRSMTSSERMRMTYDGRLGIGTTNPQAAIHAIGNSIFSGWMTAGQSQNTYYVATTGTDSGLCLSNVSPCKTIQYAVNIDTSFFNNVSSTILVASGTYQENVVMPTYGSGKIRIVGSGATPDDTVWKAATVGGTALSHKNNRWYLILDNLRVQDTAIAYDIDNAQFEYDDVHTYANSIGLLAQNGTTAFNISGSPTFTGNGSSGSTGILISQSKLTNNNSVAVNNYHVGIQDINQSYVYLTGYSITLRTNGAFGLYARDNSVLQIDGRSGHTADVSFPTLVTSSIGLQLQSSLAKITASSIFNTTNAYYRTNMSGYSYWQEGNTCTYNDTNVTIKAYLEYPSSAINSQNYLGTGGVFNIGWYESLANFFPTTFGGDVKYIMQKVNNVTASGTLNSTITTDYANATSGNIVRTLPSASSFYAKVYIVGRKDGTTSTTVTYNTTGGNTIGGASSITLSQGEFYILQSDGISNWIILNHYRTDTTYNLTGTSPSIGGGLLSAAACTSATTTITGATTTMGVVVSPVTYPGDGIYWSGYVSNPDEVTVKVCAVAVLTPTATTYSIKLIK